MKNFFVCGRGSSLCCGTLTVSKLKKNCAREWRKWPPNSKSPKIDSIFSSHFWKFTTENGWVSYVHYGIRCRQSRHLIWKYPEWLYCFWHKLKNFRNRPSANVKIYAVVSPHAASKFRGVSARWLATGRCRVAHRSSWGGTTSISSTCRKDFVSRWAQVNSFN